jgi:CheY-like chemotaxis protein
MSRILAIDDLPVVLSFVGHTLTSAGYPVCIAEEAWCLKTSVRAA